MVVRLEFSTRPLCFPRTTFILGKTLQQCWSEHCSNVDSNIAAMFFRVKRSILTSINVVQRKTTARLVKKQYKYEKYLKDAGG